MDKQKARKRIDELNKLTAYYAKKYYDDDAPEISDFEYDMLMNELKNLEREFPEFISKDSLTQKVGGTVKEGFEKVTHIVPLQSLQDVFSFDELYSFDERMKKFDNNIKYVDGEITEGANRDIPVVSTNNTIVKPYLSDDVRIAKFFYDYNDSTDNQEKAIIFYENTYMQNSGVDYASENVFDVIS